MAYDTLTYEFDELPLIAGKSGNFGMLFGTAEISFDGNGEGSVKSITRTGDKLLTYSWDEIDLARQEGRKLPRFQTVNYRLDEGSPGYFSIINSLETDRFEEISELVSKELRIELDDSFSPSREWGTLNARQQGI